MQKYNTPEWGYVPWNGQQGPRFHGDMAIIPADLEGGVPKDILDMAAENPEKQGYHILTHSETGHHHVIEGEGVQYFPVDEFEAWMKVDRPMANVWHTKESPPKHATQELLGGGSWYKIRRQRESSIEGWQRALD